jgi:hypothetical protein
MGYQLAAFVPIAIALAIDSSSKPVARMIAAIAASLGLVAVAASLQRSSLIAILLSIGVLALVSPRKRALATTLIVSLAVTVVVTLATLRLRPELGELAEATVIDKFQSEEQELDSRFRMQLQVRAVELLAAHPLGIAADKVDWNERAFRYTYERLHAAPGFYDRPFAVHNGYLNDALQFGVAYLMLTCVLLWSIALQVVRICRSWRNAPLIIRPLLLGSTAAVVGTMSFQAITHNASLTSMEPASAWLMTLLVAGGLWCTPRPAPSLPGRANGGGSR